MRYLFCFFIFLFYTTFAQSQEISKMSQQMNKIVPSDQKAETSRSENQAPLLSNFSRGDLFPKTQIDTRQNILFRSNSFEARKVFRQNKNIRFQPAAMKGEGVNKEFYRPSVKEKDEKTIKEFKNFFYKQKNK